MAVIYLKHPDHGVKVACLELEAEADEENGWIRFDINEVTAEAEPDTIRRRRPKVNNDDSGRADKRSVEAPRSAGGRRNAFSRDISGRAGSPEPDDRLVEHGASGGLFNTGPNFSVATKRS